MTTATRQAAAPQISLDLPEDWRRVPVAPDGDRRGQQSLVHDWLGEPRTTAASEAVIRMLVTESRRASRDGVAFAAVLLDLLPEPEVALLAGSLTLAFRPLPGVTDPALAAQGALATLASQGCGRYPTRRAELVGLAADPTRPAALVREQHLTGDVQMSVSQVLWLVPGTSHLGALAVSTPNRQLAREFTEVALQVASSLRVGIPASDMACT